MKALGIDFGEARIGVAVSDDLGTVARPLETVPAGDEPEDAIPKIVSIAEREGVELVVVGHPMRMDGSASEITTKAENWSDLLADELPSDVGVELSDERLSTKEAEAKLKEAGNKKKKGKKIEIDSVAAAVILQNYLDESDTGDTGEEILADLGKRRRDPSLAAFVDDEDEFAEFDVGDDDDDFGLGDDDDDDDDDDLDDIDDIDEDGDDPDNNSDFGYGGIWNGGDE